jgi:peptidoglycan/LPS O-acetylase OafA/YrhL
VRDVSRPELDGLRGLAAYVVVISHVSNYTGLFGKLLGEGGGQLGVMIFFVLSGYLMGALYLDRPFDLGEVRRYLVHRVARVVPLYLAAVLAAFALGRYGILLYSPEQVTRDNLVAHLVFASGVSVFWTVPIEVQFYLLFLALWALHARWPACLLLLSAVAIGASFVVPLDARDFGASLVFYVAYFLAGAALARFLRIDGRTRNGLAWSAALVAALALFVALYPNVYLLVTGEQRLLAGAEPRMMWRDPLYLAAALAVLAAALRAPLARPLLANRFMRFSGAISYSVYLVHLPIVVALVSLQPLAERPLLFLPIAFAATVALSAAVHFGFERPARTLLRATLGGAARSQSAVASGST